MDVTAEIVAAVERGRAGEAEAARRRLAELWEDPAVRSDPFQRCVLAHHAADLEPEVADELRWDERALAAADEAASADVAGFYPSLHLNLGDAHRRAGDPAKARGHLDRARARLETLPDDGYGQLIRGGIERLGERLEAP